MKLVGCECKIESTETGQRIVYCCIHDAAFELLVAGMALADNAPQFLDWFERFKQIAAKTRESMRGKKEVA